MLKIITGLDLPSSSFIITVQSPLVTKHYASLSGMLINDKDAPKGVSIEKKDIDIALISFPVGGQIIPGPDENTARVSPDASVSVQNVISIVRRFAVASIRASLRKTEFLPIMDFKGGYSFEELQQDVENAVKAKRQFIVIDTYESYLKNTKEMTYEFNQYVIPYGTSEYVDFALLAKAGKLAEIRKTYKNKLKKTNWF